ncbi:NUDIX domain-containing protein [Nonomuraea sp. 10N515B]|uniref:NUDIX domain-containing protein n=1 Tax=Nonomuraea sp. 10N515B TaxID=3457422 RepID=UPI003FCC8213
MSSGPPAEPPPDQRPDGCVITAHLLAADRLGHWLILRTAGDHSRWQLPGGRANPGERPRAAAEREAREEIGLALPAHEFLIASWVPGRPGRRDRLALLFATRTLTLADLDAIELQTSEVDAWRLISPSAANLPAHPLLAERLSTLARLGPGRYIEQQPCA